MKNNWEYKTIGDVCFITDYVSNGSFASLRENVQYIDTKDYAILVRLADYTNCFDKNKFVYINKESYDFLAKSSLKPGDIIMSNVGSLGKLFICPDLGQPMSIAPNSILIRTDNNKYYYYYFQSSYFQGEIKKISSTTALPKFNKTQFKKIDIKIPPLSTQQSIVSELDSLSKIIADCKETLKDYDALEQSIFYDMFGNPVKNEKGFDINRLDEIFSLITDGTHQTPTYTEDKENGVKFLSAKDVTSGVICWDNIKYIPLELHKELYARLAPQRNDILLCKNGTTGICAIVDTDEIFDIYVSLALLRPKSGFLPLYLKYAINNPWTKQQFDDSLKGVGVPNLHLGEIKKTKIILPPLALQQAFASKIEAIERMKEETKKALQEAETLFQARMDYWFN